MEAALQPPVRHAPSRPLLAASFVLLAVAAATGALGGLDVLAATEDSLHGAAGTVGWLALAILAVAAVLFPVRATPSRTARALLVWAPITAMTLSALATWASDQARTAASLLALAATLGFMTALVPVMRSAGALTVPRLGAAAALVVLAASLFLGLVLDVTEIGRADWAPLRVAGARAPSLTYAAILAGMALAERALVAPRRPATADTWGLTQVLLFLVGWLTLLVGTAADSLDLLVGSVLFHAVAVFVFLARLTPHLPRGWAAASADRHHGVVILYFAAHVGLLGHLALGVRGGYYLELSTVPVWLTFAVDHLVFVGVVANGLVGLGIVLAPRRPAPRYAALDGTAFWAMNLGLLGTVAGLVAENDALTGTGAVVLGAGMLVASLAFFMRLWPWLRPSRPATDGGRPGAPKAEAGPSPIDYAE